MAAVHKFRIGDPVWAKMKVRMMMKLTMKMTLLPRPLPGLLTLAGEGDAAPGRVQAPGCEEADALRHVLRHQ
jgi:hypothetical protein